MQISTEAWVKYIHQMSQISQQAANLMTQWIQKNGFKDDKALLDYAFALASHYGQAIGALSCRMYEATAAAQGVMVPTAEMASLPEYGEVAKAVHGTMKQSQKKVPATMARLVKQVGADTTLKNAMRDGAQFAWIPHGDTCAFCLTLASRGWQYMSKNALKNGHAEHIHANCDCEYAVRFDGKSTVEGYDPEKYLEMYKNAEGDTPQKKINALRKQIYEKKKNAESKGYEDITNKMLEKATPKHGKIKFEEKTAKDDQNITQWLYDVFGGDITCLAERPEVGKMPDAIWNGTYYEFKAPTSATAIDDRIRKAQKQLYETLERENNTSKQRGMVIDISNNKLSQQDAVERIIRCTTARCKGPTDVIIKNKNELVAVIRVK